MLQEVLKQTEEKMKKSIAEFELELKSLRTGRASAQMVDHIKVDYYGTLTPLNQLATISTPEPTLILIQPWDTSCISLIEKAVLSSDIGITPGNDGKVIRLPVPPLTEERRKQMVKSVSQMSELRRVSIRHIRQAARDQIQKLQKDKLIPEDEEKKGLDKVQRLTDEFSRKIDEISKRKEQELLKV